MSDEPSFTPRAEVFTSVFEQIADSVVITDASGRIVYVNESFELMTGYRRQEALGKKPGIVKSGFHPPSFYRDLWRTLKAGFPYRQVFVNRRKGGTIYHEAKTITPVRDETGRVSHFVSTGRDVSDQMSAEARLQRLAYTDSVTGLANRARLHDALEEVLCSGQRTDGKVALLFIDLDGFKAVNDTFGHMAGDRLLYDIGVRLDPVIAAPDMLARTGGDEFAVLVRGGDVPDRSKHYASAILDGIRQEILIDGSPVHLNASIGIATAPEDGNDGPALLQHADTAMYSAKGRGGGIRRYRRSMSATVSRQFSMKNGLRQALDRGELSVVYQPQLDLGLGGLRAMEALMRWHHPQLGAVSPGEFIPAMEESGLIGRAGLWVLDEACRQLRSWWARRVPVPCIAVNVSACQLGERSFLDDVGAILTKYELPASAVELEIVETAQLTVSEETLFVVQGLANLGVSIALDDFGTGFSSLNHVSRFPVNAVKIDREFVASIESESGHEFISRLISFVRSLDMEVIAEGVEDDIQLTRLNELGCRSVQGFYIHRPALARIMSAFAKRVAAAQVRDGDPRFLFTELIG